MRLNSTIRQYVPAAFLALVTLLSAEFAVSLLRIPVYVLPAPSSILISLTEPQTNVVLHVRVTLVESIAGFLLGSLSGFFLGVLMAQSRLAARTLLPYIIGSNAVPVIAIAPVLVLWFGHGLLAKAVVSAFLCFFPLCINTYRGIDYASPLYADLFLAYGASRIQFFLKAQMPCAIPFIVAGAKLNATYAVVGAIVGEFIGANSGLGFGMLQASYNLDVPRLWAYIFVSVFMGIVFYGVVWLADVTLLRRYES